MFIKQLHSLYPHRSEFELNNLVAKAFQLDVRDDGSVPVLGFSRAAILSSKQYKDLIQNAAPSRSIFGTTAKRDITTMVKSETVEA